jgi:hypothetical protein
VAREASTEETPEAWPDDRLWKSDWDLATWQELGLSRDAALAWWSYVQGAQAVGARWVIWYLRRVVDVGRKYPWSQDRVRHQMSAFWEGLAGISVLGHWLRAESACDELVALIETYKPWQYRQRKSAEYLSARIAYRSAARPCTDAIHAAIKAEIFRRAPAPSEADRITVPAVWPGVIRASVIEGLARIVDAVPMFDIAPKRDLARLSAHGAFLSVFAVEPSTGVR